MLIIATTEAAIKTLLVMTSMKKINRNIMRSRTGLCIGTQAGRDGGVCGEVKISLSFSIASQNCEEI